MDSNRSPKEKNAAFFHKELGNLLLNPLFKNKFVVVQGEQLQGSYDSFEEALKFAIANYSANEFIIQQVIDEREQINFLRPAV